MKNELHPWEVGIAEQMKGKEFSFDPEAFADFEQMIEAEALGQSPGHQAPSAVGETMAAGGATVSIPMVLLVIGLACTACWLFWPGEAEEIGAPAMTTSAPASAPAPATNIAPAAAPRATISKETNESREVQERIISSQAGIASTVNDASSDIEGLGETSNLTGIVGTALPSLPAIPQATSRLPALPIEAVVPLRVATIRLPTVQKPTPAPNKRDRKALFPDVIKKN